MKYVRVRWSHDHPDDPVLLYSEIDDDGWEVRKVHQYRDGRLERAGPNEETEATVLSETRLPPLSEINTDPQFSGEVVDRRLFEDEWSRAAR